MPLAEIEGVVTVSSEVPSYPAKNLVSSAIGNNVKKWICAKKGEKNASIIFKLKEKSSITNITVGNENTAIIEILVGDENTLENEYKVLLPTTELQTVQDVRAGRNVNGVSFFTTNDFNKEVSGQLWERIKVVCNQPYDSHIKFGLSCFVVKSIKDEIENDNSENVTEKKVKKEEDTVELPDEEKQKKLDEWKNSMLQRLSPGPSESQKKRKIDENNTPSSSHKKKNVDKVEATGSINSNERSRDSKKDNKSESKKQDKPSPSSVKNKFVKILNGVRFSMSGYENPLRSQIRSKALEMGAQYTNDWDSRCTHLVCAFLNTPKFNRVKSDGRGKIVVKDWIEACYDKKRRIPWRRFALDVRERQLPESEEDEEEEVGKSQHSKKKEVDRRRRLPSSSSSSSSSDTEDEIQRIQSKKIKKENDDSSTNIKKENGGIKSRQELYDVDTDESGHSDSDVIARRPDTSDLPLPPLPNIPPHNYYIAKDEKGEYRQQLKRYIHAFKGKQENNKAVPPILFIFGKHCFYIAKDVASMKRERLKDCIGSFQWSIYDELSSEVEFAITDDPQVAEQISSNHPNIKVVKSDWIWMCNDEDCLVPVDEYIFK